MANLRETRETRDERRERERERERQGIITHPQPNFAEVKVRLGWSWGRVGVRVGLG